MGPRVPRAKIEAQGTRQSQTQEAQNGKGKVGAASDSRQGYYFLKHFVPAGGQGSKREKPRAFNKVDIAGTC